MRVGLWPRQVYRTRIGYRQIGDSIPWPVSVGKTIQHLRTSLHRFGFDRGSFAEDLRMSKRFLRLDRAMEETGQSRSAIYERMANGTFPKCFPIGKRSVCHSACNIDPLSRGIGVQN